MTSNCSPASFYTVSFLERNCLSSSSSVSDEESVCDFGLGVEDVDHSTEATPKFFESGQLLWEIAAHTEGMAEKTKAVQTPEMILTDSSYLSFNLFQDENQNQAALDFTKTGLLSGQHCIELLTDENRPLHSRASKADHGIEADDGLGDDFDNLDTVSTYQSSNSDVSPFLEACEWVDSQCDGTNRSFRSSQTMRTPSGFRIDRSPSKGSESSPMSDSSSDIFSTYDPKFSVPGDFMQSAPELSHFMELPDFVHLSLDETKINKSNKKTIKRMFSGAISRLNDVLYNCTHTKQRRKERKILKKLESTCRESVTPSASSSCGVYRRRNTFICQKMEGMMTEGRTRQMKKIGQPLNKGPSMIIGSIKE